jgi:DNA-binding XRE family transcriptional regulator
MARRGRKPDVARRQQVLQLRRQGLTYEQIGAQLGITKQAAHSLFGKVLADGPLLCWGCGAAVADSDKLQGKAVLCSACKTKRPEVTFGEKLRSLRLACGMTQQELADAAGLTRVTIANFERELFGPELAAGDTDAS